MSPSDAERQELERAVELLGRTTRHGRLLAYLGNKCFQGQEAQLTEYNLATEFFGRPVNRFDAGQDAVVRVEVHRLRKKLRDIYEKETDPGGVQIALPAGSYVPQFTRIAQAPLRPEPDPPVATPEPANAAEAPEDPSPQPTSGRRKLRYALAIVAAIGAAAIGIFMLGARNDKTVPRPAVAAVATTPSPQNVQGSEVRLMSGYSGSDVIDNSGARWTADRYFAGGGPWPNAGRIVRRTTRPFLYANWRNGAFDYNIPLQRGVYELRLFFVSPLPVGDERHTTFNVRMNGQPLLTAYDVYANVLGVDVADEIVRRDVSPGGDGFLRLQFNNVNGTPWLNAIEVVPGIPGKLKPIRIITQPMSFVDHKGDSWRPDDYFQGGVRSLENKRVSGTEDPELFGTERYGHFNYSIPVDPRGQYTVVLHFVEFFFGPQLPGGGGPDSRIFHVYCNGRTLLEDFDIYKESGSMRVNTKTFSGIRPSALGKINLLFEPVKNNATISGIEILDESP